MAAVPPSVDLIPVELARDLPRLRGWLDRPHVTRWWGDPDQAMAAIREHAPADHALIAVDARPVGYLCWQRPLPEELAAAGLGDLPADLIDVDILIGEVDALGRGVGPRALTLLLERLRAAGWVSVGMAAAAANPRARRAYEKAGFRLFRAFRDAGQDYDYLVQSLQAVSEVMPPLGCLDLQPTLRGALLTLRPLRVDDFDPLFAVASDPLIWEQHPAGDRYREDVFRDFFREALASGGALVALDNADGRVIGSSRYHDYDAARRELEIGWTFLARSHWGGRYNGEMKRLMLSHAFAFVDRVVFLVGPDNVRSRRAVERIGAVLVGRRANVRGHDSVVYAITADQFRRERS